MNNHNIQISAGVTIYDKDGKIKEDINFCQPKNAYEADIVAEVKDSNGNITEIQDIPFRSYTYNVPNNFLYGGMLSSGIATPGPNVINTDGTTKISFAQGRAAWNIYAAGNVTASGIQVGTGSVSMSAHDYRLPAICPNGTGSNELLYGAMSFTSQSVSGSGYKVSALRPFSNYGSESVFVKELGVVGIFSDNVGSYWMLMIHDTADITGSALNIEVPTSGTLTVRYNFEVNPECGLNKNWNNWYYYDMQGITARTDIINILSQSGQIVYDNAEFDIETANTGSIKGLVCGSGSAAVSLDDYTIGLIQNGAGSGQLLYQAHTITDLPLRSQVTGSASFAVRRPFVNASGAPVTINEVALYASEDNTLPITLADVWMYSRFLTSGITLQDTETAEFRFVFQFTYV